MGLKSGTLGHLAGSAAFGFILAAAGCQSGDVADAGKPNASAPPPPAEKITSAELHAYCPKVTLRDGTAYFNTYAKAARKPARQSDQPADPTAAPDAGPGPDMVVYQASITDVTRSCTYAPGTMTMNVAVAGKVVPGPMGAAGAITMPIRIVVMKGDEVLYSKLTQYKVAIADAANPVQFVFNDPDVVVPQPTTPNYRVFAGYDEGPSKDAAKGKSRKPASAG